MTSAWILLWTLLIRGYCQSEDMSEKINSVFTRFLKAIFEYTSTSILKCGRSASCNCPVIPDLDHWLYYFYNINWWKRTPVVQCLNMYCLITKKWILWCLNKFYRLFTSMARSDENSVFSDQTRLEEKMCFLLSVSCWVDILNCCTNKNFLYAWRENRLWAKKLRANYCSSDEGR